MIVGHLDLDCMDSRAVVEKMVVKDGTGVERNLKKNGDKNEEVPAIGVGFPPNTCLTQGMNDCGLEEGEIFTEFSCENQELLNQNLVAASDADTSTSNSKGVCLLVAKCKSISKDATNKMEDVNVSCKISKKKKKSNSKKETLTANEIQEGIKLDSEVDRCAQQVMEGESSTSIDPSIPPGFENYN
ncbi:uncharacterized protein LOC113275440 [Papaver somniferum]|uniref:uncharacterized protein LOC113275440 n=1 Tax=Papaver somniferum TaxID=3469 RepID=UPI000E6FAB2E|nr:uncharacterized protein LOC113275440 [Papaver somniferum]